MVGTLEDAARALAGEGLWIGEGSFRKCVMVNDVVYKLETPYYRSACPNREEFETLTLLAAKDMPPQIRFPDFSLYEIDGRAIIAMEFVEGIRMTECYCCSDDYEPDHDDICLGWDIHQLIHDAVGITDLSYGNVIRDHYGTYVIVDAQF